MTYEPGFRGRAGLVFCAQVFFFCFFFLVVVTGGWAKRGKEKEAFLVGNTMTKTIILKGHGPLR